jgi:hypothetical protein
MNINHNDVRTVEVTLHRHLNPSMFKGGKHYEEIASQMYKTQITKYGADSFKNQEVFAVRVPAKPCFCETCSGTGKRSKYDVGGYDVNAMCYPENDEPDYEFMEDYFSGKTDIPCDECKGTGFMKDVSLEDCTDAQRVIFEKNERLYESEAEDEAIRAAERAMGA